MGKLSKHTEAKFKKVIDEYFVNGFHGSNAYKKVYKNASKSTAKANFCRIYANEEMKGYIKMKYDEAARVIDITRDGILKELKNWIEADITETISLTAEQIKELPIKLRRLINKYKINENSYYDKDGNLLSQKNTIELQFVSKEKAIDMLNKHIGFYEEDNRQKAAQINYDSLTEKTLLEIWNARKQD